MFAIVNGKSWSLKLWAYPCGKEDTSWLWVGGSGELCRVKLVVEGECRGAANWWIVSTWFYSCFTFSSLLLWSFWGKDKPFRIHFPHLFQPTRGTEGDWEHEEGRMSASEAESLAGSHLTLLLLLPCPRIRDSPFPIQCRMVLLPVWPLSGCLPGHARSIFSPLPYLSPV